jgi:CRP-like cAMP-binding protein
LTLPDAADLQTLSLLADLPEEELRRFAALGRWREASRGDVVLRQGDPAREALIVVRGRLVARFISGKRALTGDHVGEGDIIGEMCLLGEGHSRTVNVEATADSLLFCFEARDLQRMSGTRLRVVLERQLMSLLGRRLRATHQAMQLVEQELAEERAAAQRSVEERPRRGWLAGLFGDRS